MSIDLDEQAQIAAYLDYHTGLIDELIGQKERLIQKLEEQRQAIINEAVTKGLHPNVAMKDSGIEWLGKIPKHWEVVKLSRLGAFSKGKGINKDVVVENGNQCIRCGEIYTTYNRVFNSTNSFISNQISDTSVMHNKGVVLFAGDGETNEEIGRTVVYTGALPIFIGGGINVMEPNKNKVSSEFLSFCLNSSYSKYQKARDGKGGIIVHIYAKQLKEHYVILPEIIEQCEIVGYLRKVEHDFDMVVADIQTSIQKLKDYRQSLISEAVTGKIDVRNWQNPSALGRHK